jgi:hypothetical protein
MLPKKLRAERDAVPSAADPFNPYMTCYSLFRKMRQDMHAHGTWIVFVLIENPHSTNILVCSLVDNLMHKHGSSLLNHCICTYVIKLHNGSGESENA